MEKAIDIIRKLKEELKNGSNNENIKEYEKNLSDLLKYACQNKEFFTLPTNNIWNIVFCCPYQTYSMQDKILKGMLETKGKKAPIIFSAFNPKHISYQNKLKLLVDVSDYHATELIKDALSYLGNNEKVNEKRRKQNIFIDNAIKNDKIEQDELLRYSKYISDKIPESFDDLQFWHNQNRFYPLFLKAIEDNDEKLFFYLANYMKRSFETFDWQLAFKKVANTRNMFLMNHLIKINGGNARKVNNVLLEECEKQINYASEFKDAAEKNDFEFFKFLDSNVTIHPNDVSYDSVRAVIKNDNLNFLKYIMERSFIQISELKEIDLMTAVENNNFEMVKYIIEVCKVSLTDNAVEKAYDGCIKDYFMNIVNFHKLIEQGTDVDAIIDQLKKDKTLLNIEYNSLTPLELSIKCGNENINNALFDFDCSLLFYKNKKGCDIFELAGKYGNLPLTKYLTQYFASEDFIKSILISSTKNGHLNIIEYLLGIQNNEEERLKEAKIVYINAVNSNQKEIYEYIKEHFDVEINDAESIMEMFAIKDLGEEVIPLIKQIKVSLSKQLLIDIINNAAEISTVPVFDFFAKMNPDFVDEKTVERAINAKRTDILEHIKNANLFDFKAYYDSQKIESLFGKISDYDLLVCLAEKCICSGEIGDKQNIFVDAAIKNRRYDIVKYLIDKYHFNVYQQSNIIGFEAPKDFISHILSKEKFSLINIESGQYKIKKQIQKFLVKEMSLSIIMDFFENLKLQYSVEDLETALLRRDNEIIDYFYTKIKNDHYNGEDEKMLTDLMPNIVEYGSVETTRFIIDKYNPSEPILKSGLETAISLGSLSITKFFIKEKKFNRRKFIENAIISGKFNIIDYLTYDLDFYISEKDAKEKSPNPQTYWYLKYILHCTYKNNCF